MIALAGCTRSIDPEPDAPRRVAARSAFPDTDLTVHDFGHVLATERPLTHVFTLTNRTSRVIRPKAQAHTPCCTAIGELPGEVVPGATFAVPVSLRVAGRSNPGFVRVSVLADGPEPLSWLLVLKADPLAEWEVERRDDSAPVLRLGESRDVTLRVITRRSEGIGLDSPSLFDTEGDVELVSLGPVETEDSEAALVTAARTVVLRLRARSEPGQRVGKLIARWDDGTVREAVQGWRVLPRVEIAPTGLTLTADDGPRTVTVSLRSHEKPVRVLAVEGPGVTPSESIPEAARRSHVLRLTVDPARLGAASPADIAFRTDDPIQPVVPLTVVVLGSKEETREP
jgi:hypothetical protein